MVPGLLINEAGGGRECQWPSLVEGLELSTSPSFEQEREATESEMQKAMKRFARNRQRRRNFRGTTPATGFERGDRRC